MHFVKLYLDAKSVNDYVHSTLSDEEKERYKDLFFFMHKAETCMDASVEITLVGTPSDGCPVDTNPRRSKIDLSKLVHTSENSSELLPCPFCGGKISLLVCDDEGNVHDEEYEKDPWSGLSYKLEHTTNDDPSNECPIATDEGEGLGGWSYDTREEAIEAWNNRC